MPVRARKSRRKDVRAELDAWSMFFRSGHDFFNDLPDIGVETFGNSGPNEDVVKEAWTRLGKRYLAEYLEDPGQYGHYAVRKFGEP